MQSAIEQLQRVLSDNYLIAERLMSLRNPSKTDVDVILGEVNVTYRLGRSPGPLLLFLTISSSSILVKMNG